MHFLFVDDWRDPGEGEQAGELPREELKMLQVHTSESADDGGINGEQATGPGVQKQRYNYDGADAKTAAGFAANARVALGIVTNLQQSGAQTFSGEPVTDVDLQAQVRRGGPDGAPAEERAVFLEGECGAGSARLSADINEQVRDARVQRIGSRGDVIARGGKVPGF
jgi:hypothetical protein